MSIPTAPSRVEIRDKFFDYAAKVKAVDPNAIVLGPEEFGWSGYFNSGADLQYGDQHGWSYLPDRSTNGGMDYVCWLLNEFHKRDTNTNQRLLDYFTLHRYTEDSDVGGDDVSTDHPTQAQPLAGPAGEPRPGTARRPARAWRRACDRRPAAPG